VASAASIPTAVQVCTCSNHTQPYPSGVVNAFRRQLAVAMPPAADEVPLVRLAI